MVSVLGWWRSHVVRLLGVALTLKGVVGKTVE